MTSANDHIDRLRDRENPGDLLRRYLEAAGVQVIGVGLCVVGFLVLIYGWYKISNEAIVSLQIPYLVSGGIGGVLLMGFGGVLILTHNMRLDNRRLETLEETIAELRDALLVELDQSSGPTRQATLPANSPAPTTASSSRAAEPRTRRTPLVAAPQSADVGAVNGHEYVIVAGGTRYHLPDCAAAQGKELQWIAGHETMDMVPCRLCTPSPR